LSLPLLLLSHCLWGRYFAVAVVELLVLLSLSTSGSTCHGIKKITTLNGLMVAVLFCLQWFIQYRVPKNTTFLLVPWLQCFCLMWAMVCSFTRITDHRHHWWDVLAGFLLGAVMAIFTVSVSNHTLGNVQSENSFLKHSVNECSQKMFTC
jgi:RsiW-degrading membrane proteinase PrsW (M82 family)